MCALRNHQSFQNGGVAMKALCSQRPPNVRPEKSSEFSERGRGDETARQVFTPPLAARSVYTQRRSSWSWRLLRRAWRERFAARSSVTNGNTGHQGAAGTAGPTCRVRSVSWIAIRWRYRGCVSAWSTVGAYRSVNAGCAGCAKYSDCDCVCWRRISSKKQT